MPDEDEENRKTGDVPARTRKARPEIQIYRPGMMRKGTDLTTGSEPPSSSRPPEEVKKRPPRVPHENTRPARLSDGARRRSNDTDSVHSYRGDSGSTTPDAASICSERRNSVGRGGASRTFTRGGGARKQDRFDDARSDYSYRSRNYDYDDSYSSRNGSNFSSRQGSRDDISNGMENERRFHGKQYQPKPYNSTQSLYDSRQPGGYLDQRQSPRKANNRREFSGEGDYMPANRGRFQRQVPGGVGDRASMRAETGQRRVGGRRRNDSINSTQSERPPIQELSVDTSLETQSQAGDAPVSSSSLSYMELCKSFESIGSIDWSQQVESEYNEKLRLEEEQKTKELQQRLEACSSGTEVQSAIKINGGAPVRGIVRLNINDSAVSPRSLAHGGPPPVHPRTHPVQRGRGHRQRRDSDQSSTFGGGSIAEEVESADELASGERTPTKEREQTDRRWSSRGGRQNNQGYGKSPKRRNDGGSRSARHQENYDPSSEYRLVQSAREAPPPHAPKYRGGHDLEREEVAPSRLKGRLSIQPQVARESPREPENDVITSSRREVNGSGPSTQRMAPRGKVHNRNTSSSNSTVIRNTRDSNVEEEMSGSRNLADWPIYKEIAKAEGPQIQKLNDEVAKLLPRVSAKKDTEAAKKLLDYSTQLTEIYYRLMTKDVNFTFSVNLEQHLWKQAFHKMIEALRTGANSTREGAKALRISLLSLLSTGITFYSRLVSLYESDFSLCVSDCLVWPNGSTTDDFRFLISAPLPITQLESSKQRIALKSISRYFVALGDLHRYKTLVEGSEDYSMARSWYLKASLLWCSSGHSYNQLGVVAFYSERVLDEIFFCVRALCAAHPFEAARERLFARLAAMKKKVDKYEDLLDTESGRVCAAAEIAARADQPRELWMTSSNGLAEVPEKNTFQMYLEQSPSQLHRRTVSYMIHTAGLLISKIGMEQFNSVSSRALSQLAALVQLADSPMTSQQLVQLALVLVYAVHVTGINAGEGTCSVQQQLAVQTVVSYFGALLRPLRAVAGQLAAMLVGEEECPKEVLRVLPAVVVLSEWFSCCQASTIYRTMPSVDPLSIEIVDLDTWGSLAEIANVLADLDDTKHLSKAEEKEGSTANVLPEMLFVASFLSIFPVSPRVYHVTLPEGTVDTGSVHSLHCRLRIVLSAAEFIDGSELSSFHFDEEMGRFRKSDAVEEELLVKKATVVEVGEEEDIESSPKLVSREEIVAREQRKRQAILVVNPTNVVLDTNVLVDHLDEVGKLIELDRFQIMVPTIVIDELLGLSQNRGGDTGDIARDAHATHVTSEARRGVAWLREKAKEKCARMNTLTTKGQKMGISIVSEDTGDSGTGKVNDDRILDSCTAFVERNPAPPPNDVTIPLSEAPPIYRNLVLLSEDRGICIKASSQNIPTRNMPSFLHWVNNGT